MACYNYCVTYYPIDLPVDLYVRYSRCSDDITVTELISTLETVDNLDGTYTACISVSDTGSYPTPVCVQGGLEIVCPTGIVWVNSGLSVTPTPTPTQTPTPSTTPPLSASCECYQTTNTTPDAVNITYTPCGNPEATVSVPGYGVLNFCVEPLTIIYPGVGLTYPSLCNIPCEFDGVDCTTCGATPTPTPTNTLTPTSISFSHLLYTGASCNDACDILGIPVTVYTTGSTINVDDHFYLDSSLTIDAEFGYYSDGINCYDYFFSNNGLNTAYVGVISPCGVTPTPTPTNTQTPTQTQTGTAAVTPTTTLTATPTQTQTQTGTAAVTPTQTPTTTQTKTPTPSVTIGLSPTTTETPTQTPTQTSTQTQTPTQTTTQTSTPTPTAGYTVQFADCTDNTNIFRFYNVNTVLSLGAVYLIDDSSMYSGCATVITSDGSGPLYDGSGVIFTQTASGCADPVCPRVSNRPALLYKCSNSTIFYANVEEDTAFVGAAYLYNGECYSFVEFSGPGGPNVGDPDYEDCNSCVPTPTPTSTPQSTPTNTPTVSITPLACTYTDFCFYTYLPSLSGYSGNYTLDGTYNTKNYYSGDGTTAGVIYYNTGVTENYWCLSNTLGGTCVLQGATPCYSECPDIAANDFYSGVCPTPTPTQINCSTFDFNAYFDCDWEPLPTPTPSVACDDVNFTVDIIGVTPTPTPTGDICNGVGISFSMSGYTPAVTPTITLTPSVTLTNTVPVGGQVTFPMVEETFSCVSVKVLTDCQSGDEYYVTDGLSFIGVPVVIGMTILVELNGEYHCVSYTRDDSNFSSNTVVGDIIQLYSVCEYCSIIPTPTPTVTTTPTVTPSSSQTPTPSITASPSVTPSQTATVGTTPPPTPNQTNTQTPTNTTTPTLTPTPSTTPNYVYVYESCSPIFPNLLPTQMIQTERVTFVPQTGVMFKDSLDTCWNYIGRFDSTYIAPPTVLPVTYSGNYFDGSPSIIYTTCVSCEEIPASFGLCEQYQYWSGTRCDTEQTIIVKSCYSAPTEFTINTFEFGFAGGTNSTLDFNVKLGDIAIGNDGTDDFCVTINSELGVQNTNYIVSKPIGFNGTSCTTCPVYKAYYANACDGSEQNVTLYYLTSESPFEANGGNIVSVSTTSTCYTILSYIGLVSNPYISPSNAKFIIQGYADCQVCADAYYEGGGVGDSF